MNSFNTRALRHTFSLLHADYVRLNHKWNYTNVISPYYRIYYIDEGEGEIITDRQRTMLEPHFLYLVPSFTLCNLRCDDYLSQYFLHLFEYSAEGFSQFESCRRIIKVCASETDIANFRRLLQINPGRGINRSDNPRVYEKGNYYLHYQHLNDIASDAVFFETQGIILQLIARFLETDLQTAASPSAIPSKILDTINYIQLHLAEKLSVAQLSKRVNLNEDHFSRLFLRVTSKRPAVYIYTKRIERAQYLSATTHYSFAEIAEQTGFETVTYFARVFKKVTTLTPGEYRKKNELFASGHNASNNNAGN